jgi:hypothetical protein
MAATYGMGHASSSLEAVLWNMCSDGSMETLLRWYKCGMGFFSSIKGFAVTRIWCTSPPCLWFFLVKTLSVQDRRHRCRWRRVLLGGVILEVLRSSPLECAGVI